MAGTPHVFPYVLARLAGGPFTDLQHTEIPTAYKAASEIIGCQREAKELAAIISETLYPLIPHMSQADRRIWITVRRSIYQGGRPVDAPPDAQAALPGTLQKKLKYYRQLHVKLEKLQKTYERQYAQEVIASKKAFKTLLVTNNFQKGLLLSSTSIGPSLDAYIKSKPDKTAITKKERSFMEYLSRMYTKPSPFSSFTHLAMGVFSDSERQSSLIEYDATAPASYIQLNHGLYRYLTGLLMSRQELRPYLSITLNRTIIKQDGAYRFLTNHLNTEAFQRITATPSLDVFYKLVADRKVTYGTIINEVVGKKYIKATAGEVIAYLDQLIDLGFFRLHLGASGVDRAWDKKLLEQLSPIAPRYPPLQETIQGLSRVRALAEQYETAPIAKRRQLLTEAFTTFKSACESLGATLPQTGDQEAHNEQQEIFRHTYETDFTLIPHKLWYEDTALIDQARLSNKLRSNLDLLGDLLARLGSFDPCQKEWESMAEFFKRTYGVGATITVLQFYKDYTREKNEDTNTKPAVTATEKREAHNQKVLKHFSRRLAVQPGTDEVHFGQEAVAHLKPVSDLVSFEAYFHVYETAESSSRLVLNSTAEGYGKMFSRFLHFFDPDVTRRLQETYSTASGNALFAEITDASFFNANLHPRIMPYEIITPGGHASLPASAQLAVDEITVVYRAKGQRLALIHRPSGKEVIAFDIGFQGSRGRSRLYSLLSKFQPNPHYNVGPFVEQLNDRYKKSIANSDSENIVILPRVVYEKQIVLQRKSWKVPQKLVPLPRPIETDAAYFLRLNTWRQELQLPDEVFVKGRQHKPQYISFRNPFLVALFVSSARDCQTRLSIEEMLPTGDQLAPTGRRVVEFLTQWDMGAHHAY